VKQGANLAFLKPDLEILDIFNALGFFLNQRSQTKSEFFQSEKLDSGKTLSELHIHCKSLLTRVYDHVGCKEYCKGFTVP